MKKAVFPIIVTSLVQLSFLTGTSYGMDNPREQQGMDQNSDYMQRLIAEQTAEMERIQARRNQVPVAHNNHNGPQQIIHNAPYQPPYGAPVFNPYAPVHNPFAPVQNIHNGPILTDEQIALNLQAEMEREELEAARRIQDQLEQEERRAAQMRREKKEEKGYLAALKLQEEFNAPQVPDVSAEDLAYMQRLQQEFGDVNLGAQPQEDAESLALAYQLEFGDGQQIMNPELLAIERERQRIADEETQNLIAALQLEDQERGPRDILDEQAQGQEVFVNENMVLRVGEIVKTLPDYLKQINQGVPEDQQLTQDDIIVQYVRSQMPVDLQISTAQAEEILRNRLYMIE